jgi:hypothetical protein
VGEEGYQLAKAVALLALEEVQSPGYGRWTNLYRHLATECGARRGRQVRLKSSGEDPGIPSRDWLAANGLLTSGEPPPWLLAMFRKHRKGFSALQHLIVWTSLRPGQHAGELISEAKTRQVDLASDRSVQLLPAEFEQKQQYRAIWLQALANHGGAGSQARRSRACYAWLYRHDRHWLMAANQVRQRRQGNNSHIDWRARDIRLVRLLIRIGRGSEEDRAFRAGVATGSCSSYPIGHQSSTISINASVPHLPGSLCRVCRRVSDPSPDCSDAGGCTDRHNVQALGAGKALWIGKSRVAPLTTAFIRLIGRWIE